MKLVSQSKLIQISLIVSLTSVSYSDWLDDTGINELLSYLGETDLPTVNTSGVPVALVEGFESGTNYLPISFAGASSTPATGTYAGITFHNESDTSTGASGHAGNVASYFFAPPSSFVTGVTNVHCHSSLHFLDDYMDAVEFLTEDQLGIGNPSEDGYYFYSNGNQVLPLAQKVTSHAYIGGANAETLAKFDFLSTTGNTLMVAGLDNGSGNPVPLLWASAYNGISVGTTSNNHSNGDTPSTLSVSGITGGRTKPEIVSNGTFTSWATAQVSSGATHLYGYANQQGFTDITANTMVQRAILLAGATKEEFPSWQNASSDPLEIETRPLDPNYGAGEMNVFHSHRIIEAGAPAASNLDYYGWDFESVSVSTPKVYTFTIPAEMSSADLSAVITWDRTVSESESGGLYSYSYNSLKDLNLSLSGGAPLITKNSNGTLDNLEHIYATDLEPGTYTLTVSKSGGPGAETENFGLAWRINFEPVTDSPATIPTAAGMELTDLVPNLRYEVYKSTNLTDWDFVETFTPTSGTHTWTNPSPPGPTDELLFYRLRYWK